jgi:protein-disulfide isomerase
MANLEKRTNTDRNDHNDTYTRQVSLQTSNLLITLLVAGLAFATGYFVSEVRNLKAGKTVATAPTTGTTPAAAAQPTDAPLDINKVKSLFTKDSLKFGDTNAKLLFVEFTDPSCPFCHVSGGLDPEVAKQAGLQYKSDGGTYVPPVPEMKKLVDEGKAAMVLRYTTGHGAGHIPMEALYCANEQGKFWEAHDLLMNNEGYNLINNDVKDDRNNDQLLVDYLANVVDPSALKDCIDSKKYEQRVADDEKLGQQFGVQGTPQFIVNTTAYKGAYSWSDMEPTVNKALGK